MRGFAPTAELSDRWWPTAVRAGRPLWVDTVGRGLFDAVVSALGSRVRCVCIGDASR